MIKVTKTQLISKLKKLEKNETLTVKIIPCKVNPLNEYFAHAGYNQFLGYDHETKTPYIRHYWTGEWVNESLEKYINTFSYYNCQYHELGKYPAYYII